MLYLGRLRREGTEDRVTGKERFKINEISKIATDFSCQKPTKAVIQAFVQQNECLLWTKNCVRGFEGCGHEITVELTPKASER